MVAGFSGEAEVCVSLVHGSTAPRWHRRAAGDFIHTKKKVLMLGSGMVAGPAVEDISKRAGDEPVVGQ